MPVDGLFDLIGVAQLRQVATDAIVELPGIADIAGVEITGRAEAIPGFLVDLCRNVVATYQQGIEYDFSPMDLVADDIQDDDPPGECQEEMGDEENEIGL